MKHGEFYTCKRYRLYTYLAEKGFRPEKTLIDPRDTHYNWWLFRNSVELEQAITEYFEEMFCNKN